MDRQKSDNQNSVSPYQFVINSLEDLDNILECTCFIKIKTTIYSLEQQLQVCLVCQ